MSLFSIDPVTPDITAASHVKKLANNLSEQLLLSYMRCYNLVWNNPDATPVKVVAALSTEAVKVFNTSYHCGQLLNNIGITNIPLTIPSGYTYVANADGSITLNK